MGHLTAPVRHLIIKKYILLKKEKMHKYIYIYINY
jgi:hypothetical protein